MDIWRGSYKAVEILFKKEDFWVGVYWQRDKCGPHQSQVQVWVCLLPMFPIRIYWLVNKSLKGGE